jgi:membrane fusion protein, copper/silver efflux system
MKEFISTFVLVVSIMACSNDKKTEDNAAHDHSVEQAGIEKYTCPMHPNVVSDKLGKCPVCGMDLVRVNKGSTHESTDLMLTDSQIKLANITTQKVSMQPIGQTVVVNGTITRDEDLSEVISSRVAGRIEKLSVKETGRTIQKGEPLFQIYSETLLTIQREFLLAKEQYESLGTTEKRYKSFFDAAKRKLLLYGMSDNQIDKLAKSKVVQNTITFLAPTSGVITEVSVSEGQYVSEGMTLMRLENVSRLWLEAELYQSETSLVEVGDKINLRISGFEHEQVEATVSFLSPEFRANTQVVVMRASVANPDLRFQPGMQAQVVFTHSQKKALALPVDAVIRDANGTHVYVQRGVNTFRPNVVKTGLEDFEKVEITEGLSEGDTVVVTGAYLLYSEIILKKGRDPMAVHSH